MIDKALSLEGKKVQVFKKESILGHARSPYVMSGREIWTTRQHGSIAPSTSAWRAVAPVVCLSQSYILRPRQLTHGVRPLQNYQDEVGRGIVAQPRGEIDL